MAEFAIRVEESVQLVDPASGALRGRVGVRGAAAFCARVEEAVRRIGASRVRVAAAAAERGLAVAAAGLNPAPVERSSSRRAGEAEMFGLYIQVAVPDAEMAVHVTSGVAPYIPHLLALSASSPLYDGEDTGFSSFRTALRELVQHGGIPVPLVSAAEYEQLVQVLGGSAPHRRRPPVNWDVRPVPDAGAVEYRFLDACPRLSDVFALAACVRALTGMLADRAPPQPTGLDLQLWKENRWRAARHGLGARLYRLSPPTGEAWEARHAIRGLLDRLDPLARRLGDAAALAGAERILERGNAAVAMRAVYEREGSQEAVARWLVERTAER